MRSTLALLTRLSGPRRPPGWSVYRAPRLQSTTSTTQSPLTSPASSSTPETVDQASEASSSKPPIPAYELTFACKPCKTRSTHRISKHGYHRATVLVTCPNCKARHVISDHLNIFSDTSRTLEDILREKGESIKKGSISPTGDVEFWEDGTTTPRTDRSTSADGPSST